MKARGRGPSLVLAISVAAATIGIGAGSALAAKSAKFKLVDVSDPPATASPGDTFEVAGSVKNKGKKGGKATVSFSLRSDDRPKAGPIDLGSFETERLKPRAAAAFVADATIPEDVLDDPYTSQDFFMVACAEPKKPGQGCKVADGKVTVEGEDPPAPVFEPGSRSLGDELFPQIGNGGYDASHYEIDLDYDPVSNVFLDGTSSTMTATATQNLSEFSMDFQDVPVSSVTVNGVPAASFEQVDAEPGGFGGGGDVTQPMKLVVTPATGVLEGDEMTVEVAYAGTPGLIIDADGSLEGWIPACYPLDGPQTCDGAFVVNEPIGAQGWFPSNNFPTDRATYDTSVTVPVDYEAVGIGELVSNGSNGDGTETWAWSISEPTSTYLTTATVGNFDYTKRDITETSTGAVLPQYEFIDSSATPTEKTTINTALGRTGEITNFLSDRFGPYPYSSGGAVVDKAAGVGYALEVATKSHYAGNFTTGAPNVSQSTLAHEISHQWMGNAVTLTNWNDIWWQEGWGQYSSWMWNFKDGTSTSSPGAQWSANYASGPATKWDTIPTELNGDPADLFATFPTYTRGAMTYQGYREIVGGPKFFEFARELQTRFAYSDVSSEDVVDLMLEISDFEGAELAMLEEYFDQWLYEAGKPTITANDFT